MNAVQKGLLMASICSSTLAVAQAPAQSTCDANLSFPAKVYDSAGLEKLSEAEQKLLLDWIRQLNCEAIAVEHQPGSSAAAVSAKEAGTKEQKQDPTAEIENFGIPMPAHDNTKTLQAAVKEPFRGWSGKTVFYLDNGQVWKQRVSGKYTYGGDDNRVEISQNRWGFFEMRLVAADRSVGVSRVK